MHFMQTMPAILLLGGIAVNAAPHSKVIQRDLGNRNGYPEISLPLDQPLDQQCRDDLTVNKSLTSNFVGKANIDWKGDADYCAHHCTAAYWSTSYFVHYEGTVNNEPQYKFYDCKGSCTDNHDRPGSVRCFTPPNSQTVGKMLARFTPSA